MGFILERRHIGLKMKSTYLISEELKEKLKVILESSSEYGIRKKSKWIREALIMLYENDKKLNYIGVGSKLDKSFVRDSITLDDESKSVLKKISTKVRRQQPLKEGVQSEIIRSAIRYRIVKIDK